MCISMFYSAEMSPKDTIDDGVIATYDLPARIEATHLKDIREAVERLAGCVDDNCAGDVYVAAGIIGDLSRSLQRYTKERWLKEKKKEDNGNVSGRTASQEET